QYDAQYDYDNRMIITLKYNDNSSRSLRKTFNKDCANERKIWVEELRDKPINEVIKKFIHELPETKITETCYEQYIDNLIDTDLFSFVLHSIVRSIPGIDGLKESQRKLIWGAFEKLGLMKCEDPYSKACKLTMLKTNNMAAMLSEVTQYQHGEVSLTGTLIKMTQAFAGSNNINLFEGRGEFGS